CSRIEHETAAEKIGVSPSVVESVSKEKDIVCRKIGSVSLRGKSGEMDLYEVVWREEDKASVEKTGKVKLSSEQIALATGTRLGLDEDVRKAIAAAVKGKAQSGVAPAVEKKKFALIEVLPDRSLGKRYPLSGETVVLGREKGDMVFPSDTLLSREHAAFTTLGGALYVEDLGSANGTFVRIRESHPLQSDDIILLGRQMFRFRTLTPPAPEPPPKPEKEAKAAKGKAEKKEEKKETPSVTGTHFGSAGPLAELIRLGPGGVDEKNFPLPRGETVLGRTQGTYTFPEDRYLSRAHARFRIHGGHCTLEDLKSTNGTFVRIRERHLLDEEDTVLVGSLFLRVVQESG
ncbi:MAG: FHA domain-containing protein, partial [Candidatus Acidiferrales bacterium]